MIKFILIIAVAVGGYFLFQKVQSDKNQKNNIQISNPSTASGKVINNLMNENIDSEFERKTAQ